MPCYLLGTKKVEISQVSAQRLELYLLARFDAYELRGKRHRTKSVRKENEEI